MLEKIMTDVQGNKIVIFALQVTAAIVALMVVIVLIQHIIKSRSAGSKWHKIGRWGELKKKRRSRANGIVFGRIPWRLKLVCSLTKLEGHIVALGGSGAGKTAALLIATLRAWLGNALVFDISGDICKRIQDPHKIIYEPENAKLGAYSVFAAIDTAAAVSEKNERLQQLAFALIPDTAGTDDTTKFYNDEARKLLQAALIAFYHAGLDFCPCCQKIVGCNAEELLAQIANTKNPLALQLAAGFEGTGEKTLAATLQEVHKALMLFATNENMTATLQRGGSSPHTLENSSLYVVIPDEKLELYAPLLRLITVQTLGYLSARPNFAEPKILLALDEFASLGKIDILPALRKLRKKNVRVMVLTQSLADLDLIYGEKERRAMLENFDFKAILACGDTDTAKYFSDLAGEQVVKKTTINKKIHTDTGLLESETEFNTRGESTSEQREKVLPPEELRTLAARRELVLFHPAGLLRLKKYFYFDKLFNKKMPFIRVPYKMPQRKYNSAVPLQVENTTFQTIQQPPYPWEERLTWPDLTPSEILAYMEQGAAAVGFEVVDGRRAPLDFYEKTSKYAEKQGLLQPTSAHQ